MKKNILLVEDEALIAMNEKLTLERNGFTVVNAYTGEEAVDAAVNGDFDLILMDIDLGKDQMDGTEAAEKILSQIEIPIVFCTSHTEREIVQKVKGITGYGYIIKNTGEFVLIESINMALELFEAHSALQKENTGRIKAEKESQLALAFYHQIMENNIDAVYLMNETGEVLEVNNIACEMLDYSREEFSKMTIDDIDINYPAAQFIEFWKDKPEGATILFESIHIHKSGEHIPVEIHGIFFLHENQKYLFGVARDIRERKRIEAVIKNNEKRYIKAQELGNVGNWEYNIKTEEFWGSAQAKKIYGFPEDSETFTPEEVERCIPERERVHQALIDLIEKEKEYKLEFDIICSNSGDKRTIISTAELEKDEDGKPLLVNGVIQDITEMKKTLVQKETLMNELSHRVKNNLLMISSLIEFTNIDLGDAADLSGLKSQVDAIMNTYNALYQTRDFTEIDIKEYLNNLLKNIFIQSRVDVKIKFESDIDRINSNSAVTIGLIINESAMNALKHGFKKVKKPEYSVEIKREEGTSMILLNLSNNGSPIPESVVPENPGTLGLRLISELVKQMKGTIEIQKEPFPVLSIRLPAFLLNL